MKIKVEIKILKNACHVHSTWNVVLLLTAFPTPLLVLSQVNLPLSSNLSSWPFGQAVRFQIKVDCILSKSNVRKSGER